uniref:G-protein coupled receptors family 2 profile 1 domain-containing protein n=1 Tax=Romanomermis culicivorax TaxID=13658 RepID=A0A915HJE5_ROMCU
MAAASTANANPYRYMAASLESCLESLQKENMPTFPQFENETLWCNATWDSFLCWPAIPANTSYSLPCPPIQGLKRDPSIQNRLPTVSTVDSQKSTHAIDSQLSDSQVSEFPIE